MAKKIKDLPGPTDVTVQDAKVENIESVEIFGINVIRSNDGESYSVAARTNVGRVLLVSNAEFAGSDTETFINDMLDLLETQVLADDVRRVGEA